MMKQPDPASGLLQNVSRSIFWNTFLLPGVAAVGLLLSIVIRRSFGLESGLYDATLGVGNSILFYSSLGLSGSLPKFLPELQFAAGRHTAAAFITRLTTLRIAVLVTILIPLNLWAVPFADAIDLGPAGPTYLRWLSLLLIGRATLDMLFRVLESFFRQLSVNALSLLSGLFDLALVVLAVSMGLHLTGVIAALAISMTAVTVIAIIVTLKQVRSLPGGPGDVPDKAPATARVWRLSIVTYVRDLSLYFATPAFASPVLLTVLGGPGPVALFTTSYFVASSTVTLVVSSFRGVYRPAFVRVLATNNPSQLHRAFDLMNKMQVLLVVPAGVGLGVMVADYLPLLYGESFLPAVPIARTLIGLLFAETALAVALVVLWADERHRAVLGAELIMIAGAPLFVWTAGRWGLMPAAIVLGGSRLGASLVGYVTARRLYGVRYPWAFAGRVLALSAVMAAMLLAMQAVWGTSAAEAATLTAAGVAIVFIGLRMFRLVGPEDLEVLERSNVPGMRWLLQWLDVR
jgi:O-antigen/teichoic acid export membrane protein